MHELHTGADVRLHECVEVSKERLALMLLVHGVCLSFISEFAHLHLADFETAGANRVNNFSRLRVTVRFDECESSLRALLEPLPCEDVGIVDEHELPGVDNDGRANEELALADTCNLAPSHENPLVLQVVLLVSEIVYTYHLN